MSSTDANPDSSRGTNRNNDACPECGQHIAVLEQSGPTVILAQPCGHRVTPGFADAFNHPAPRKTVLDRAHDLLNTVQDFIPQTDRELPDVPYDHVEDVDDLLGVLSNERRRELIRYLSDRPRDDWYSLGVAAETIAARENNKPREDVTSQERKTVYVTVYQCHAPKLDTAGIINMRERDSRIQPGPEFDRAEDVLGTVLEAITGDSTADTEVRA